MIRSSIAKTRLFALIAEAVEGKPFIIAKAGKPLVKVARLETPEGRQVRVGFMIRQIVVPDDFDSMGRVEIEAMLGLGA